ncbi:hypothetical protein W97_01336 [Coniosporium apollinis CBS 100218]|uniref:Uncharacterized protein n=1 Tax=Coniosporium apollinis (strain CBS 100218) TaxID=1168221 RepID=R7YJN3_CONA1|nr:uncharacterized protein W97_01336 [Coniosporium apollinis CBS 100218]EON62117.1 hypothetical protein W97_01336 [Coniosporium apollinis CBS 100218]
MPQDPIVSTGRGGAGNIGQDPTVYTDGGIVREGYLGAGDGDYSTGRGGAGNIAVSPRIKPQTEGVTRLSEDVIPETDLRTTEGYENFHTGRGGSGNVYKEKYGGHSHKAGESFGDKIKQLLGRDSKDEKA